MSKSIVVVDDDNPDSLADRIASVLGAPERAEVVNLSTFLYRHGVRYNAHSGVLDWDEDALSVPTDDTLRIYNRVVEISNGVARALQNGENHGIPANFVFAAYAQVLSRFSAFYGTPGLHSPVGNLLPLNLQWLAVSRHLHDVGTPRFKYGFGAETVDVSGFSQPIVKSLFDIYTWRTVDSTERPALHPFVVERPSGSPVLVYFVGDRSEVFDLESGSSPDGGIRERLLGYLPTINEVFKAFMGEVLFFVDGERITFTAFSHYLKTASNHPTFDDVLARGLEPLVSAG